jgi:plasmid stabilization system protein ParE
VKLRILSPAQDEIFRVIEYYDAKAIGLGAEFAEELDRVLDLLRANPEIGGPFGEETRRVLLRRFPFGLVYITELEELVILAVAHQSREPGYWRGRI